MCLVWLCTVMCWFWGEKFGVYGDKKPKCCSMVRSVLLCALFGFVSKTVQHKDAFINDAQCGALCFNKVRFGGMLQCLNAVVQLLIRE